MTVKDIRGVIRKLVELAQAGDLDAMKLLLDRVTGKPTAADQVEPPPAKPPTIAAVKRSLAARIQALASDIETAESAAVAVPTADQEGQP